MLDVCESVLNRYYNFRLAVKKYSEEVSRYREVINENFHVDIYCRGVHLTDKVYDPNLKITYHVNNTFYSSIMKIKSVGDILNDKNSLLFKNAYINIEKLPSWLTEGAYSYRINEVKQEIKQLSKMERKSIFKRDKR